MEKYHLVLSFPCQNTTYIKKLFTQNESTLWLYLGQDFFKRRYVEQELSEGFSRINIARLHNEVAWDIRHEYVHWIDDLNRRYGRNLEWWFGSISSRDVDNSNIFQFCCYLEILERLWKSNDKKPELIFIESIGLARAIQKWAAKKNITIDIVYYKQAKLRSLTNYLIFFLRWGHFAYILLLRLVAARITMRKYKLKKLENKDTIIVDTFLHDYSISEDGIFQDRYFPYLHEYLYEKGMQVLVHPVLAGFRHNYFSIYKKMRRSSTYFIFQEDFLHFSDYISALIYPIKVFRQKIEGDQFLNFNISDILIEEKRKSSTLPAIEAILIYRLFVKLGQSGLRPRQIIDWYENQVIDKALIAGAREAFSQAKIIGVQSFIHSPNNVSLYPSQSEVDAQIVPHLLLEISKYQCQIAHSFTKNISCKSAAALRYSYIFKDECISNNDLNPKTEKILVLLPCNVAEAIELLETLKEALEQIRENVQILIKGHPDYSHNELIYAFGEKNWPNRFEIFHGIMPDALKLASVAISSNSSSMVEAAAKGIPVIFLGRQTTLNYNVLSNLNMEIITECFSTSELVKAVNKYLNLSPEEKIRYKEIGKKIRDLFFEPVNEKTLLPYLNIE